MFMSNQVHNFFLSSTKKKFYTLKNKLPKPTIIKYEYPRVTILPYSAMKTFVHSTELNYNQRPFREICTKKKIPNKKKH